MQTLYEVLIVTKFITLTVIFVLVIRDELRKRRHG